MAEPESSCTEMLICDSGGNVIFQAGDSLKVRVHRRILSVASPVFRNMFDGRFQEGQKLNSSDPPVVPLPEDDPTALATLCTILHWMSPYVTSPKPEQLLQMVILADKYDCMLPFKVVYSKAMSELLSSNDLSLDDLFRILLSSYYLREDTTYRLASNRLVMNAPSIQSLVDIDCPETCVVPVQQIHYLLLKLYGHILQRMSFGLQQFRTEFYRFLISGVLVHSTQVPQNMRDGCKGVEQALSIHGSFQSLFNRGHGPGAMLKQWQMIFPRFHIPSTAEQEMRNLWEGYVKPLLLDGICLQCTLKGSHEHNFKPHNHEGVD